MENAGLSDSVGIKGDFWVTECFYSDTMQLLSKVLYLTFEIGRNKVGVGVEILEIYEETCHISFRINLF